MGEDVREDEREDVREDKGKKANYSSKRGSAWSELRFTSTHPWWYLASMIRSLQ